MFTSFTPGIPARRRSPLARLLAWAGRPAAPTLPTHDPSVSDAAAREQILLAHRTRQEAERARREVELARAQAQLTIR